MAGVTICNDFGAQENKSVAVSIVPHLCAWKLWVGAHYFVQEVVIKTIPPKKEMQKDKMVV